MRISLKIRLTSEDCSGQYVRERFEKFNTKHRLAMQVLNYQKAKVVKVIQSTNHEKIDGETAVFLNRVAKLGLKFDEKDKQVDMCKAMQDYKKKNEVTGIINYLRLNGASDETIIMEVQKVYDVTREYVLAILKEQAA